MALDSTGPIDPDRILDRTFATVRRGVDPAEVERYLLQIANQMRSTASRVKELERELENYRRRPPVIDPIDPSNLTKLVGEETVRVLDAAQSAAAEIRARAEENVARMLREAREESSQLREEAEVQAARRTEEAEAAAAAVRERSDTDRVRAEAEAAAIVDDAKRQGREMLAEAQQVRQRMLDDLSRRRQGLREQIEQLQASRDRLAAAYDVVRDTLAVATEELQVALPEPPVGGEPVPLRAVDVESDDVVTPIVTLEEHERSHPALNEDITPLSALLADDIRPPHLTVVPPPADEPEPGGVGAAGPEPVASGPTAVPEPVEEPQPPPTPRVTAPAPIEGRHSSSVRVVRTGKAADVFARLREEGAAEAAERDEARPGSSVDPPVESPVGTGDADGDGPAVATPLDSGPETDAVSVTGSADEIVDAVLDDQSFIAARDDAIASIVTSLTRRVKRELSDEQNELLATVGTVKGNLSAIALLPTPETQLERYEDIALPALAEAAAAGASLAPLRGRGSAHTSVGDLASDLATSIVGPLRDRLERGVAESAGDRDDLTKRIRSTFREWKGQRVDGAVEHAVLAACNRGLLDRLPRSAQVRWVVAAIDDPSPDCEDNSLAGSVTCGQPFPTGHVAPPLHPGCHCVVLPVVG